MPSYYNDIAKGSSAADVTTIVVACFLAMAMYNVLELNVLLIATFKRRNNIYFWSLVIAILGIPLHGIGWLLKDYDITANSYLPIILMSLGWYAMVTGQSVVLYSRLHLVLYDQTRLRSVLAMIVLNAIICHIPTTILTFSVNSGHTARFLGPYLTYEKIQVTLFFFQEIVISGLYINETARILRTTSILGGNKYHSEIKSLLCCNIAVIILDVTILALAFSNLYSLQTSYKGFAYSLKLKLEFGILSRLVESVRSRGGA